uniref:Uncharacterized protein n=1 Tax=Rhizophagus irregularis (strain DAOM 181602 / DAOM 197198 / MUCL 43194) TaxID=747089 RepID=U9UNE5_RHIID
MSEVRVIQKSTTKMSKVQKRKNESESEGSPGETAQKTSRKQATQIASQKRKKFESESESSSAPKRRVNFCEAPAENAVIPDVEVTIPDTYIQPNINGEMLSNLRFRVANVAGLTDVEVRTFFKKLHKFVTNGVQLTGTTEKFTDTLVDDLLRIVELNDLPFSIG